MMGYWPAVGEPAMDTVKWEYATPFEGSDTVVWSSVALKPEGADAESPTLPENPS